ncbi:hypothetical protein ACFZBU_32930 [Embleya sp. NPDC008237]|uniref:hypothetical protein n=1 Tax=Embleya sp. NPDC008237 TaxID=3363978 RepID=UPI0036F0D4B7
MTITFLIGTCLGTRDETACPAIRVEALFESPRKPAYRCRRPLPPYRYRRPAAVPLSAPAPAVYAAARSSTRPAGKPPAASRGHRHHGTRPSSPKNPAVGLRASSSPETRQPDDM